MMRRGHAYAHEACSLLGGTHEFCPFARSMPRIPASPQNLAQQKKKGGGGKREKGGGWVGDSCTFLLPARPKLSILLKFYASIGDRAHG